jgi:hypothetical protein
MSLTVQACCYVYQLTSLIGGRVVVHTQLVINLEAKAELAKTACKSNRRYKLVKKYFSIELFA